MGFTKYPYQKKWYRLNISGIFGVRGTRNVRCGVRSSPSLASCMKIYSMSMKNQSNRLATQQKGLNGAVGIFGSEAKLHDLKINEVALQVSGRLEKEYPQLRFRHRSAISKEEINEALKKIDPALGQTLFVPKSRVIPDGGLVEVKDDSGSWRVVLVSEAKHQGRDVENIREGRLVGKGQDLMVAGNAIERAHKNISEFANLMLGEQYFPYVLFLEGSNFLTETISVERPDGRVVELRYDAGSLNRLDRLTAANYGMPINTNLCKNKFVAYKGKTIMLQAASIYTQGDGAQWSADRVSEVMLEISRTSIQMLASDLFRQLTGEK